MEPRGDLEQGRSLGWNKPISLPSDRGCFLHQAAAGVAVPEQEGDSTAPGDTAAVGSLLLVAVVSSELEF